MGFLRQVVVSWRLTLLGISGAGTGSPRDWHGVLGYGQGGGSPRDWTGTEVRDRSVPLDHGTLGCPLREANARCGVLVFTYKLQLQTGDTAYATKTQFALTRL